MAIFFYDAPGLHKRVESRQGTQHADHRQGKVMILRDLRDLTDAELFVQIGGDWGVQDCLTELARRLSNLRKHLSEALVGWDETCDKLDAAEADRDRLRAVVRKIARLGECGPEGDSPYALARAALKEEK